MDDKPSREHPKYFHELSAKWQVEVFQLCDKDYDLVVSRVWFWHNGEWCSYQV